MRGGGIERAGDIGLAMAHVPEQQDAALFVSDGLRLHRARVVDDTLERVGCPLGGQDRRAAVSLDETLVLDQGGERGSLHLHRQQPVAIEIEQRIGAGGQRCIALDGSLIDDGRRDQRHDIALDGALIDDGAALAAEMVFPCQKILIRQPQRRGDKGTGLHRSALADQHAVRIDEEHLAVGVEGTENLRRHLPDDAVERDR